MKKIISELRKTIAVILIEHALDVCPNGEFKLALAKFVVGNIHKMDRDQTINVDIQRNGHQPRMFTATLGCHYGVGKTAREANANLFDQIERL